MYVRHLDLPIIWVFGLWFILCCWWNYDSLAATARVNCFAVRLNSVRLQLSVKLALCRLELLVAGNSLGPFAFIVGFLLSLIEEVFLSFALKLFGFLDLILFFLDKATEIESKRQCCIVARRQHHAVHKLLNR